MERDTPAVGNAPIEGPSNSQGTQHPLAEVNISSSSHLEDDRLIARATAVGVDYEFAKPGEVETEDDRSKRQQRNQRRISEQEKTLGEVVVVAYNNEGKGVCQRRGYFGKRAPKRKHLITFSHSWNQ